MKVFITRDIKETDFFKTALKEIGFAVFGQSLIEFSSVPFGLDTDFDWLFFYSKNGIRFFFNQLTGNDASIISNKKIGAIGKGTAQFLKRYYQHEADFVGNGEPLETARAFAQIAAGTSVIFPRARTSQKSIQEQLSNIVTAIDLVIYENQPKTDVSIPNADILVMTSPLNTRTYFNQHPLIAGQQVIAIGNTTATQLRQLGIQDFVIAKQPTEKGLIDAVISIAPKPD